MAAAVGVPGVPVRVEVAVAGSAVVQQMPDDDQHGSAHGAAGLFPPAPAGTGGEAAEALAQEGVGLRGGVLRWTVAGLLEEEALGGDVGQPGHLGVSPLIVGRDDDHLGDALHH